MPKDRNKKYSDFSNVDRMKNELIPEEFPEGPFGSTINKEVAVSSKSTPWKEGQKRTSAFVFPDEEQHDDLPRQIPGAHPLHDE
ncbi:hypothetical protein [Oceanobacillus bengalensis]|uniref:Cytosolic protein n=1 Tax=Oceanobacillus bengalensis TaxID=1435466 RepID=A0A494YW73_9BACI|nr:hypothetical protein [Oceanobacillus bengalensis]RKQ14475.1 hypothetical protein D8M05_12630 [Oceanobacillus bengalensis]